MTKRDAVYLRFETIEEEVAHCYFLLQERFLTHVQLGRFWADAALDELQHASILRYCREHGLMRDDGIDPDDAGQIDETLDTVKDIVTNPQATVDDAFFAALLMESSELDQVFSKLVAPLAREHPLLYQAVIANLNSHHNTFADGAMEFANNRAYADAFRALGGRERIADAR